MLNFIFKAKREYILITKLNKVIRIVVSKAKWSEDKTHQIVESTQVNSGWAFNFKTNDLNVLEVIEPVDSTDFMIMYTNWNNFVRPGPHQDLEFAAQLHQKIINTFNTRSYVVQGSSKFEAFDLNRLKQFDYKFMYEE